MVDTVPVRKFLTSNMKNRSVATRHGILCGIAEKAKEKSITALTMGYFAKRWVVSVDICKREASVIKLTYADRMLINPFTEAIIFRGGR